MQEDYVMSGSLDGGNEISQGSEVFQEILDEDLPTESFNLVFYEKHSPLLDKLNLARTLFDLREYKKCANHL